MTKEEVGLEEDVLIGEIMSTEGPNERQPASMGKKCNKNFTKGCLPCLKRGGVFLSPPSG